eukprot:GHRR01028671.1.p1 GENE.GHRR01028671.1~~GHRR01028671.1.p1  ORF type:complete len:277 (+),score=64.15 GHRR01028671.1:114-833(+)
MAQAFMQCIVRQHCEAASVFMPSSQLSVSAGAGHGDSVRFNSCHVPKHARCKNRAASKTTACTCCASCCQVVEVQQVCRLQSPPPLADLAGLFGLPDDSVDPFTLYGTNFKKYQIERLQGEKVLSRQRGFTVDSCVSAITASEETPEFNGLSTGDKVQAANGLLCKRSVGPDLKQACKQSCATACTDALAAYEDRMFAETGYKLQPKERERVLRNCRHSCSYECTKSGKAHDFAVPYRK